MDVNMGVGLWVYVTKVGEFSVFNLSDRVTLHWWSLTILGLVDLKLHGPVSD